MSKKSKTIRVKLIVNPDAGNASEADNALKLVTGYLKKNGLKASVARAKPKAKATPLARQAIKDGYEIVIAMGGDGTVEAVMRGMVGSKTRLGIIPAGIENNIAKSLGIPGNLEEACALIASRKIRKLDVSQVKTGKGKNFAFFEMAGIGLSAAMYPAAGSTVAEEPSSIQEDVPAPVQKETRPKVILTLDDNNKIEADSMLVMVVNTPVFGKKFLVTPTDSSQAGLLDISVFQDFSKAELLRYHANMMDGGYSGDGKVLRYQARKLKVMSLPRLKVTADGIEQGKGTVTIKVRSGALRVIAAKKSPDLESPVKENVIPVPAQIEVIQVPMAVIPENLPEPVSLPVKKATPRKRVISGQKASDKK
jgi:diacylglycerol kinase family enzyme